MSRFSTGQVRGKRVPADCPLTLAERRTYVESGGNIISLIKAIKEGRQVSLAEAADLAKQGVRYRQRLVHDRWVRETLWTKETGTLPFHRSSGRSPLRLREVV
jgi:hypothetical protein